MLLNYCKLQYKPLHIVLQYLFERNVFVYMTKQNYEKYDCIEKGYICNTVLHPTSLEWYYKFRSLPCLKYQDKNVKLSTEVSERDAL